MTRRVFLGLGVSFAAAYLFGRKFFRGPISSAPDRLPAEAVTDKKIVRAAIHPGIGIARVGNSTQEDGFFIGPEVAEPTSVAAGQSHDSSGALKKQAARFRIYGYNQYNQVVGEILPQENIEVRWQVHLANKKSSWYRFTVALDLEEAKGVHNTRRNPNFKGAQRRSLVIDPGPRTISGKNVKGPGYRFDSSSFMKTSVSLGELRTDDAGRLLVLGGHGRSESPTHQPVYNEKDPDSFNNADGWFDDTSDGPVRATVSMDGKQIPVEPAWVAVAPPNYAPNAVGWRTMYEMLVDTFVRGGFMEKPKYTSFTHDVLPTLRRLTQLGWLNKGFADTFAKGSEFDFDNPAVISRLSENPKDKRLAADARQEREKIKNLYDSFRLPEKSQLVKDKKLWPMLYGDAFGSFDDSFKSDFIVPEMQALHLNRWIDGDFINDWQAESTKKFRQLSAVPLSQQPATLDKAALHFCLADAFHPGCELTWPMRHISMYSAPFRIKQRSSENTKEATEKDFGDYLTSDVALSASGPLNEQGPGDLTKWMAMPWQGDTVFCRSGYEPEFDPYIPSFWPARVPNQVLTETDYKTVMNESLPRATRVAAFQRRASWTRNMKGSAPQQMQQMVEEFGRIGVVEARPGIKNDPVFPEVMFVESISARFGGATQKGAASQAGDASNSQSRSRGAERESTDPVIKAGWESDEQLKEFRKIRFR